MVRAPYFDENGIRKGAWSEEEDKRLIAYIERYGHPNWRQLPKSAGLTRCGKSCRLRWMNYLRPNLKRGKYTQMEEQMIVDLHREHGNKWSLIAEKLPGRTDNEIKNYWHSHLKKFPNRNDDDFKSKTSEGSPRRSEVVVLESSMSNLSSETSNTEDINSLSFSSGRTTESTRELVEDSVASWETTFDGFSSNFWTEPFISDNELLNQGYYFISERDEPFFL